MPLPPIQEMRYLLPDSMTWTPQGVLHLAGHAIPALAQRYGTPLYIFDRATIVNACTHYREAFRTDYCASPVQLRYASKAYLSPTIARLMAEQSMGLDVVSAGELLVAHRAGFPMQRVTFHGNALSDDELRLALQFGVGCVVVDNWSVLARFTEIARATGARPGIMIRIAPEVETDTHRYLQTGHAASKFGFPYGEAKAALLRILREGQFTLRGLHAHSGTMLRETRPYEETLLRLLHLAEEVYAETGWWPQEVSPGGGWACEVPGEDFADVRVLARALHRCLQHMLAALPQEVRPPTLVIEPGRSIIARAGIAVYHLSARKAAPGGINYLFVDGGMGDNIRPALYGARYIALAAEHATAPHEQHARVAGRYCESGDVLIEDALLPDMQEKELLLVPMTGAYCLPMASTYNLVPRPAVILVDQSEVIVMERRETYDDLLARYGE